MNRAHSFWSIGFFAAGLAGAAVAQLGLSPQLHLALVVPVAVVAVALLLGGYQPAPKRAAEDKEATPRFARPTAAILVLVGVTLSAMLMEGASMDWSAIYMRNVFDSGPFLAGFAVAAFAFSQATTRFFADSFVDRHSPTTVARFLICVMAVGVLLVFFSPAPLVSLLGFCFARRRHQCHLPAGDLGRGAAHRPLRGDQRRRPGSDLLQHLPARAAAARLRRPALGHPLGLRPGLPLVVLSFLMAGALGRKPAAEIRARANWRSRKERIAV